MQTDLTLQEKKDQRIAAAVSVVFHVLLLILLFFMMAWRAKNPPDPELGIEIALGFTETGSGDVRTSAVPNPSPVTEDSRPPAAEAEVTPTPPTPPRVEPVKVEAPKVEPIVTTTSESPVVVKKEEVKPKPTPQPKEEPVKPKEEVVKKEEPVKEPEKPKTLFPGKPATETGATGTAGKSTANTGNSSGDDAGPGAKGSPEGNARSTYPGVGKAGGGAGGSNLNMPGWRWDSEPRPNDTSNESGRLVFRVRINSDGQIESVQKIEGNVSPAVEKLYRDAIYRTTFSRTNAASMSTDGATGVVSFTIQAR